MLPVMEKLPDTVINSINVLPLALATVFGFAFLCNRDFFVKIVRSYSSLLYVESVHFYTRQPTCWCLPQTAGSFWCFVFLTLGHHQWGQPRPNLERCPVVYHSKG